ncbi:MAG: hypothetical protein AAFY71_24705 [Bacteroidota bacterium]
MKMIPLTLAIALLHLSCLGTMAQGQARKAVSNLMESSVVSHLKDMRSHALYQVRTFKYEGDHQKKELAKVMAGYETFRESYKMTLLALRNDLLQAKTRRILRKRPSEFASAWTHRLRGLEKEYDRYVAAALPKEEALYGAPPAWVFALVPESLKALNTTLNFLEGRKEEAANFLDKEFVKVLSLPSWKKL